MDSLIIGDAHDPHATLGAHPHSAGTTIRTLRRGAGDVSIVVDGKSYPTERVHIEGIFAAELPGVVSDYRVDVDGRVVDDPYRHLPTLGELDLHLIREGRHERLWDVMGAHAHDGGCGFTVWAPNARGVRVVGDFTGWGPHDGWPMRSLGASGVWELYVPGAQVGHRVQVPDSRPGRRLAGEGRSDGAPDRGAAVDRVGDRRHRPTRGTTATG